MDWPPPTPQHRAIRPSYSELYFIHHVWYPMGTTRPHLTTMTPTMHLWYHLNVNNWSPSHQLRLQASRSCVTLQACLPMSPSSLYASHVNNRTPSVSHRQKYARLLIHCHALISQIHTIISQMIRHLWYRIPVPTNASESIVLPSSSHPMMQTGTLASVQLTVRADLNSHVIGIPWGRRPAQVQKGQHGFPVGHLRMGWSIPTMVFSGQHLHIFDLYRKDDSASLLAICVFQRSCLRLAATTESTHSWVLHVEGNGWLGFPVGHPLCM